LDILVLGCSGVFLRRVLPALNKCSSIDSIHVASKNKNASAIVKKNDIKIDLWFNDYDLAIETAKAELVYISLPNHLHYYWAKKALNRGLHVVVEKPATLNLAESRNLVDLSVERNLCLAEAVVWQYHPNVEYALDFLSDVTDESILLEARFTVPAFNTDNFRNYSEFGGGAFNDMSAYAASISRVFFNEKPINVTANILASNHSTGIDTEFKIKLSFNESKVIIGNFGFDLHYKNHLVIKGTKFRHELNRVFSPPSDIGISLNSFVDDMPCHQLNQGDCYARFFQLVLETLDTPKKANWAQILLQDALLTHAIKESFKSFWEV